jgi:hypothetical protein
MAGFGHLHGWGWGWAALIVAIIVADIWALRLVLGS